MYIGSSRLYITRIAIPNQDSLHMHICNVTTRPLEEQLMLYLAGLKLVMHA